MPRVFPRPRTNPLVVSTITEALPVAPVPTPRVCFGSLGRVPIVLARRRPAIFPTITDARPAVNRKTPFCFFRCGLVICSAPFTGPPDPGIHALLSRSASFSKSGRIDVARCPERSTATSPVSRTLWDAIIAFKKASIAFLTSFVTTPELEVHWVVAMTGSFILLNEFGQPYNNPRELERLRDAALRDREKTLRLPKQQKGLSKYGSGTNGRLSDIKVRLNVVDPGTELQRLDSLTCYVSMVTAWSGLFFILFPYCSDNEIGCATLLVSVMAINVAFLVYCVLLFRVEIVSESRRVCRLICTRCGKSALHATPEKEVSEVELRRVKNSVHGNPLLYRKSFVAYQNTVNPLQVALEKSEGVILQLRTSKAKAYSRRSEKIKRLIHARQGKKKNSHGADDFEWARVIKGDGSETYYYNPRTGEKRKNDPRKDWVRAKDEDGNAYYYHTVTNEVRWNIVEDGTHGWVEAIDQAGNQYFHHPGTGETSWTDPRDPWEYSVDEETGKAFYCHIRTGETHWINEVDSSGEEIAYEDNPMRHEPHTSQNVEEDSRVSLQDNPMRHEI